MARPIKETPILFGSDARRFEERMKNPPKVSPEKRAQIRKSYETVMKMMVDWNDTWRILKNNYQFLNNDDEDKRTRVMYFDLASLL